MYLKLYVACLVIFIGVEGHSLNNYSSQIKNKSSKAKVQDSILHKEYEIARKLVLQGEYKEGLKKSHRLYERGVKFNNIIIKYKSSFLIGEIYRLTRDYEKCLLYYKESLDYILSDRYKKKAKKIFNDDQYGRNLLRVASTFLNLKLIDSGKIYCHKILELDDASKRIITFKAATHTNLSGIYQLDSLYDKAEEHALKAEQIYRVNNNKVSQARAANNLANIYLLREKYTKAAEKYTEGISLIRKDSSITVIKLRSNLYFNLAWTLRNIKDYKAYDKLEISYNLKDSLRNDILKEDLERIQGEYDVNLVRKEEELKRQKAQRNTWVLGISSVSIIIVLTFLLNQYKLRQKNLRLALSQKETESQMEILNANLSGQEAERKRISQELHDGVLSRLFGSRMGLGYLELDSDKETQSQYQKYLEELQSIEKEIREVSHQLSSDVSLSETSFLNAINQLLKEKSELGSFGFQLKMDDSFSWKELDGVLEMNLFRILQESLQNIIKHAQANDVFVSFKVEKQKLLLEIKDDGVGYDTKKKTKGIGLKNIKSRVKTIKGTLNVSSEIGKGTLMQLDIPMSKE